ncbi:MAG: hypothetical protein K0R51_2834 [Cytophagaceae bacterium]|jgi:hypothetical protein|nr:hypothetical protein [Cytophagaceae bacterium]
MLTDVLRRIICFWQNYDKNPYFELLKQLSFIFSVTILGTFLVYSRYLNKNQF